MQDLVRQWKAKPLHGRYRSRIEDNAIDTKASQGWLQSGGRQESTPYSQKFNAISNTSGRQKSTQVPIYHFLDSVNIATNATLNFDSYYMCRHSTA
ncbi:unnamed protein product [Acanthoscelides obtectus]|uniref:Uncharacterized protein n=1 Tax=Acanthoscelides obtectus TaxID=200917 RepID=A0A9P0QCH5_ACAOB|nr:unnamed protein product [Acanthoscelides obtectus]CAK1686262.1 hypothetical protein AOBTE_LOCUS35882 [Acanthoscelides obtectus]